MNIEKTLKSVRFQKNDKKSLKNQHFYHEINYW